MAASNEWTEWHLTPRGWEEGSSRVDFRGVVTKPEPPDRVLTTRFKEYIGHRYSKPDRAVSELWRSDDSKAVEHLLERFGLPPESL